MQNKIRILPKIFLFLGLVVLFLAVRYYARINSVVSSLKNSAGIHSDNFFRQSKAESLRRRPLSLVERETELKLYLGEPFKGFSYAQWEEFWSLIFDVFPEEYAQAPGEPIRVRQLSSAEIADKLMKLYPDPFAYFKTEHWEALFGVAFKK